MVNLHTAGVYKITNSINNKIYVGSSKNIYKRWYSHREKNNPCILIAKAMKKHGKENFFLEILEVIDKNCSKEELKEKLLNREQYWLDILTPYKEKGYNILKLAYNRLGAKMSSKTKKLLSIKAKLRCSSSAYRTKLQAGHKNEYINGSIFKDGITLVITGIRPFCKEHPEFERTSVRDLLKGDILTYKGWKALNVKISNHCLDCNKEISNCGAKCCALCGQHRREDRPKKA